MDISRTADYFIACYTVLMRPNKVETAVHGCKHDVLITEKPLRGVFNKVLSYLSYLIFQFGIYHAATPLSFLRSISLASLFVTFYFWLIRSFTDPAFTGSIFVCGPLHHHVSLSITDGFSILILRMVKGGDP